MVAPHTETERWHKLIASFGSGSAATAIGTPLDALKSRILLQNPIGSVSSLARGFTFSLALSCAKTGGIWWIEESVADKVKRLGMAELPTNIVSGGFANIIPNTLFAPANMVKFHLQREATGLSAWGTAKEIHRTHGMAGFYKGAGITAVRDSIWGAIYFTGRPKVHKALTERYPNLNSAVTVGLSSLSAALAATIAGAGIDAARTYVMNHDREPGQKHTIAALGARAYTFNGRNMLATTIGVTRVGLSTALGHTTYLLIRKALENGSQPS